MQMQAHTQAPRGHRDTAGPHTASWQSGHTQFVNLPSVSGFLCYLAKSVRFTSKWVLRETDFVGMQGSEHESTGISKNRGEGFASL